MNWIKNIFKKPIVDFWEYGYCNNKKARRHKINGNVQFVLWEDGEQGYKQDFWINFDKSYWNEFKLTNN